MMPKAVRQLAIDREVGRRRPRAQHIALRLRLQLVQNDEQARIAAFDRFLPLLALEPTT